jgi:Protein of unknown function (DUF2778)
MSDNKDLEPSWIYAQNNGNVFHVEKGIAVLKMRGYSGNGDAENNPDKQLVKKHGPIPRGWYTIAPPKQMQGKHTLMQYCLKLSADKGNEMGGRTGFWIHDGNFNNHGQTSDGCICLHIEDRIKIWTSGDHRLYVVDALA